MPKVCLAILNYNGRKHLELLLPTAREAAKRFGVACAVVVLDNSDSTDDAGWVRSNFGDVEVARASKNDYLFSYNWFASERDEDVLILLNNDLRLAADFVQPLVRHFVHQDVFAVSAKSFDWDGQEVTSGPIRLKDCGRWYAWDPDYQRQELSHTLFTSGGFMAVDRRKFVELGGFNRLFYPAYGEDLDLCFRAWRRRWRCIYEPASIVYHRESATWKAQNTSSVPRAALRSNFLFHWSSLPGTSLRVITSSYLLKIIAKKALRLDFSWPLMGLSAALRWLSIGRRYRWMKTGREELNSVLARIAEPCVESREVRRAATQTR